jgi:nicotinamidase-related amidase
MVKVERGPLGPKKDQSRVALLLIDVINDFEFEGGQPLMRSALKAAKNIAALKRRAKAAGIPVIYVNDNFGRWRSDFKKLVDACLDHETLGKPIVEVLLPEPDDYFVLKPKHSAFHATPLSVLLSYLGVQTLILTGVAADNCILLTAGDAHMKEYRVVVPADCVAAQSESRKKQALKLIEQSFDGRTTRGRDLNLQVLMRDNK